MQKLKTTVLQKMIEQRLSSKEIDFLFSIGKRQDSSGCVHGIYYQDIMEEIGCSKQQFYNMLHSLSRKGIITYEKASYYDYDVTILGNDFPDEEHITCGYLSLNKGLFCEEFRQMRAGEKLLAMELMRRQNIQFQKAHKPSLCYLPKNFLQIFSTLLNVTKRVIRYYLKKLKAFFSIGKKEGYLYVTPLKRSYTTETGAKSDLELYREQEIRAICRRNRILTDDYSNQAVKDTVGLIAQYKARAEEMGLDILSAVREMILKSVQKSYGLSARKRRLEPPLIHKLLQQYLNGFHSLSIPDDRIGQETAAH